MVAPVLIGAGIGAITSFLGGRSQKKAAKRAAEMAAQNTRENNALAERFYGYNKDALSPWMASGMPATSAFNELLGLPGSASPAAPVSPAFGSQTPASAYSGAPSNARPGYEHAMSLEAMNGGDGGYAGPSAFGAPAMAPGAALAPAAAPAPSTARSAFDRYRDSTGYQFRMEQGLGALQKAFGRSLDSGAAAKSALRFGQGIASDEFGKYMQLLDNQQRLGFGAASALAGVNQNMASTLIGNNNDGASARINARLYQGNSNANMWNSIGSSFGQALGGMKGF